MGGQLMERDMTRRCPICGFISVTSVEEGRDFYFLCKNFDCTVERIYGDNAVMLRKDGNILIRALRDVQSTEKAGNE